MIETGESGFDENGGGEGIPGEIAAGGDGIGLGAEEFDGEPGGSVEAERFEAFKVRKGDGNLVGCVEADEAKRPAGSEDGFKGERIEVGVPLGSGGGGNVAGRIEGAAHPDEVADRVAEAGLFAEGEGEVGEGAESEYVERGAAEETAFEIGGGRFGLGWGEGGGERAEELAGGGAPGGGKGGGSFERAGGADIDRDAGTAAIGEQTGDGVGSGGGFSETMDDGDGFNADVGPLEQKKDGEEVVGAGVGIDVDGAGWLREKARA